MDACFQRQCAKSPPSITCKDVNKRNSLQTDQHFPLPGDNINKHAKFTRIEQLNHTNMDKELLKHKLKKPEDFWNIKLKTLQPHGCNAGLNFPNPQHFCISCASVSVKAICRSDIKNITSQSLIPDVKFVILFLHWKKNIISPDDSPRLKLVETDSAFFLVSFLFLQYLSIYLSIYLYIYIYIKFKLRCIYMYIKSIYIKVFWQVKYFQSRFFSEKILR